MSEFYPSLPNATNNKSSRAKDLDKLLKENAELRRKVEALQNEIRDKSREFYGLSWIDVPEAFEEESKNKIPVLEEVRDKAVKNSDGKPTHILIEGDNYHALTCLNYTHRGKIDVIYIDPPYNTENDGFTYKDARFLTEFPDGTKIDKNHPLRHSAWLSFMAKRLELAKNLLSERGVIFISIDDNEQANLKLLCDKVFGEGNFVAMLPTIMNLKGNQDEFGFAGTHEYTLVYAKQKTRAHVGLFNVDEEEIDGWLWDEIGYYKKGAPLKRTGQDAPKMRRPYGFFPILVKNNTKQISVISKEEFKRIYNSETRTFDEAYLKTLKQRYESLGFSFLLPITENKGMSWRWGRDKVEADSAEIIVVGEVGSFSLYKKQRPVLGDLPTKKPKSTFYKPEYSSGNGTAQIKDIFGEKVFENPKPIELIKDFVLLGAQKSSIVLDFFAGSGTTMHATMKLNAEDGGKRQCILVTNNENQICEKVTYERNRRVMCGYVNSKGENVAGLGNSMKYYRTAFVGGNDAKNALDRDKRELSRKAGALLSLAENTLEELSVPEAEAAYFQIFSDGKYRFTAVYFTLDWTHLDALAGTLKTLSAQTRGKARFTVYVYSDGLPDIFEDDLADVPGATLKAIPRPILEIYKTINGGK